MSFLSISLPLAFLTFRTGSAQAAKMEVRKGAVRNVQICRTSWRRSLPCTRISASGTPSSQRGDRLNEPIHRQRGQFVDDGVFIAVMTRTIRVERALNRGDRYEATVLCGALPHRPGTISQAAPVTSQAGLQSRLCRRLTTPLIVQQSDMPRRAPIAAALSGTDGRAGRYAVIPVRSGERIRWLDASGFRFAVSDPLPGDFPQRLADGVRSH
jgi:hypothetical protein